MENEHRITESQVEIDALLRNLYSILKADGDTPDQFIRFARSQFDTIFNDGSIVQVNLPEFEVSQDIVDWCPGYQAIADAFDFK